MSTMTLEPCPFCGAKDAEVYPRDRSNLAWNVCCGNPGCVTRGDNDYLTKSDAVAAWNRRAHLAQPAQAVDVGAIREVIDALRNMGGKPNNIYNLAADKLTRALSGEKAGPVDGWLPTDAEVRDWLLRSDLDDNGRIDHWRTVIDDARSMHLLPASPAPDKEG